MLQRDAATGVRTGIRRGVLSEGTDALSLEHHGKWHPMATSRDATGSDRTARSNPRCTMNGIGMEMKRLLLALLLLAAACGAPEKSDAKSPRGGTPPQEPCRIDDKGNIVDAGGRSAMCCPVDYVAGGNPQTSCLEGTCCPIGDDMQNPPPMPPGPSGPGTPWGGPGPQ
jgi:hypothetical protein